MTTYVIKSGLVDLVEKVRTYLTARGVTARVAVGFKARDRQLTQGPGRANRIVFTPSDDSGAGGSIVAARGGDRLVPFGSTPQTATGTVKALRDWERVVLVSVWTRAVPVPGADEDAREEADIEAAETLLEWMMRAVYASGGGYVEFGDVRWTPPDERSFGLEARVALTFRHPMFDVPADLVRPSPKVSRGHA